MAGNGRRYLDLRGLKWWFKRDIPKAIRGHFGGQTAYLRNLQTADIRIAQMRRDELARETDRLFRELREGKVVDVQRQLRERAETWAQEVASFQLDRISWIASATGRGVCEVEGDELDPMDLVEDQAEQIARANGPEEAERFLAIIQNRRPVEDHIDAHLREASIEEKSKGERRAAVTEFAAWAKRKRLTLPDVTRRVAGEFVSTVLTTMHRKTGSKRLSNIKRYWDWLIQRGHFVGDNPWERQALPGLTRKAAGRKDDAERAFTEDEMKTLLAAPVEAREGNAERLQDAMRVAALSGMRIEELCRLRVMDCTDAIFRILDGKTANSIRDVPIHPDLTEIVARRVSGKKPTDRLFSDVAGKGASLSDPLSKQFGRFIRDIKVAVVREGHRRSKVNFHSFRRWFVTKAEQAGQQPHIISTVVGHAEGRKGMTLGRYSAGPAEAQLRACVEAVRLPK